MSLNLRSGLHADLQAGLPDGYALVPDARTIDRVAVRTVQLWAASLDHLPEAPNGHYVVEYTVNVLSKFEDPQRAEADLDEALEDVLTALWGRGSYALDRAERTTHINGTVHGWTLTVRSGITINTTPEA